MDKTSILSLANIVENEYSAFLNQVKKLEVFEFPTSACVDFVLKLKSEGEDGLKKIRRIRRKLLSPHTISNNWTIEIHEIKAVRVRLIQSLAPYIDWLNGAQTQKVPWSFIPTAERFSKGIIPKIKPILYSENKYNYRIVWWENPKKKLQRYCFVSLPSLHRTNVLMHNLIGHELFHPKCKQFTKGLENSVASEIAEECKEECKRTHPEIDPNTLWGQRTLAQMNKISMLAWERALHELLCDMFCAELFGPASLLGMRAYASFSDWMTKPGPENNFYPPLQYRFEVVWQKAIDKHSLDNLCSEISKHESIDSIGKAFRAEVDRFAAEKALESTSGFDFVNSSRDPLLRIAYKKVNDVINDAHKYVMSYVNKMSTKWKDERVLAQIPHLVIRLTNRIPPSEIPNFSFDAKKKIGNYSPEAAELPAILIAGWMYQVHREQSYAKKKTKLLQYETLCRLLLKACEDSEMIRSN